MDIKQFQEELNAFQAATPFPKDKIPGNFKEVTDVIFKKQSPQANKMSIATFKQILTISDNNYSLTQIGYLINACTIQTMASLDMELEPYCEFMTKVEEMVAAWKELVEAEKTRLTRKYETLQNIEDKSGRTIEMPVNNKKGKTKPVAEA